MTDTSFAEKGKNIIRAIFYDDRTIIFLLGMGIESGGLAVQFALGLPAYPALDTAVVAVLIVILYYIQRNRNVQQP